jgi:Fic-DOC domain mobile mystery protein B
MGLNITYEPGQTPLDEDEKDGLLIPHISTIEELNEFEQQNIEKGFLWLMKHRSLNAEKILSISFVKEVHQRMFSDVWKWAGDFRKTNKNIGVDKFRITETLLNLLKDCTFWIENSVYDNDEIAIQFKHNLVSIHPFSNGNGRHSRFMADVLIEHGLHGKPFTWGRANLFTESETRSRYIHALQEADRGEMQQLIEFARS